MSSSAEQNWAGSEHRRQTWTRWGTHGRQIKSWIHPYLSAASSWMQSTLQDQLLKGQTDKKLVSCKLGLLRWVCMLTNCWSNFRVFRVNLGTNAEEIKHSERTTEPFVICASPVASFIFFFHWLNCKPNYFSVWHKHGCALFQKGTNNSII